MFGFQRLDVYRASIQFLGLMSKLVAGVPRGHGDLVDQLRRAALSVPLNLAEGSGKFSRDAVRFYAVFGEADLSQAGELLERVVSMLTGLIRP